VSFPLVSITFELPRLLRQEAADNDGVPVPCHPCIVRWYHVRTPNSWVYQHNLSYILANKPFTIQYAYNAIQCNTIIKLICRRLQYKSTSGASQCTQITGKTGSEERDSVRKNDRMSKNTVHTYLSKGTIKKMSFQMAFKSGCWSRECHVLTSEVCSMPLAR